MYFFVKKGKYIYNSSRTISKSLDVAEEMDNNDDADADDDEYKKTKI